MTDLLGAAPPYGRPLKEVLPNRLRRLRLLKDKHWPIRAVAQKVVDLTREEVCGLQCVAVVVRKDEELPKGVRRACARAGVRFVKDEEFVWKTE